MLMALLMFQALGAVTVPAGQCGVDLSSLHGRAMEYAQKAVVYQSRGMPDSATMARLDSLVTLLSEAKAYHSAGCLDQAALIYQVVIDCSPGSLEAIMHAQAVRGINEVREARQQ